MFTKVWISIYKEKILLLSKSILLLEAQAKRELLRCWKTFEIYFITGVGK